MKRFLLSVMVIMLTTMGLMAQDWSAPTTGTYTDNLPVYITPQVNGTAVTEGVKFAAFVGDECRGVAESFDAKKTSVMPLLVAYNQGELPLTITLRAYYNGSEYFFKTPLTATTNDAIFKMLNIQAPTAIEMGYPHLDLNNDAYKSVNLYDYVYFTFGAGGEPVSYSALESYPLVAFSTTDTEHVTLSGSTLTAVKSTNARGVKVVATCGTLTSTGYAVVAPIDYEVTAVRFGTSNDGELEAVTRFDLDIESADKKTIDFADYIQYEIITGYEENPTTGEVEVYKDWVALKKEQSSADPYLLSIPTTTITIPGYTVTAQTVSGKLTYVLTPTVGTGEEGAQITLSCTVPVNTQLTNTDAKIYVKPFVVLLKAITLSTSNNEIPLMGHTTFVLTPEPTNASDFLAENYVLVPTTLPTGVPSTWHTVETDSYSNTANTLGVTGYCIGNYTLSLYKKTGEGAEDIEVYKDIEGNSATTTLKVGARYEVNSGWDWVSYFYFENDWMTTPDDLYESIPVFDIRSQTQACYYDEEYGFFGTLTEIKPSTAYKVCSEASTFSLDLFDGAMSIGTQSLYKGYTWVGYPYQYSFRASSVLSGQGITFANGDKVIGQNGSLEYKNGIWTGSLAKFESGHSYIFYVQNGAGQTLTWKAAAAMGQPDDLIDAPSMSAPGRSVWSYDSHAFMNNMTIVAAIEGDETYEIGAFVGEECRGEGTLVEFEGQNYYFITVHGKAGEVVSFKAYDGSYKDFGTTVSFSNVAGSLTNPLMLSGDFVSGISTIASDDAEMQLTDLSGRPVAEDAHGIFVVRQNGVSRKVVK